MLAKRLPPLHYSNLAASDTKKRPNLRQTLRKSAQIPPYGYIAAIGLVASAEQAYAVVVDTNDITSGSITPDIDETLIDLSSLDVSGFTPDTTNLYASLLLMCPVVAQPPSGTARHHSWSPASQLPTLFEVSQAHLVQIV